MTTVSVGYVAKAVMVCLQTEAPEVFASIEKCKGATIGVFASVRVLQVHFKDGTYMQSPFLAKGTHYGRVIADLVEKVKQRRT